MIDRFSGTIVTNEDLANSSVNVGGALLALVPQHEILTAEAGSTESVRTEIVQVPVACRAC